MSRNGSAEYEGVLSKLFESPSRAKILDFFLDHKEFDYPASEIAEKAGLSFRHVLRELPKLEKMGLIIRSRKVGKASMFRVDTNLAAITLLEKMCMELARMPSFNNLNYKVEVQIPLDEVENEHGENKLNVSELVSD